jgi:predicted nucleic acid-binding protein
VAYAAVLDADALHPYNAVDLLLRLAERRLFRPIWSEEILNELRRSLTKRGLPQAKVDRRIRTMDEAFHEAMVSDWERHLPSVPDQVSTDDRHVVAAALAAKADGIVTNNRSDFPADALADLELDVQSLDEFFVNQVALDEEVVIAAFRDMEADRAKPPRTAEELLAALENLAPDFVAVMRLLLATN